MGNKKEPFSISISSDLREKIEKYVNKQDKSFPNDERYKNKSAFLNYILEKVMEIINSGKTLEDLDKLPDSGIIDFFENISFRAVTDFYENAVSMNKFTAIDFLKNPKLFLRYRDLLIDEEIGIHQLESMVERIKKYILTNKLTEDLNFYITGGKTLKNCTGTVEYSGTYKNLHYENTKGLVVILGALGLKVVNFLYSEKELYSKFDFIGTDLSGKYDINLHKLTNLVEENLKFVSNYSRIVNDEDHHLWMELANYEEFFVSFHDEFLFEKWVEEINEDFKIFLKEQPLPLKLLKLFESIHWINIFNDQEYIFTLNLSKDKNDQEFNFLYKTLSEYGTLKKEEKIIF
jgi:hypothetical protein